MKALLIVVKREFFEKIQSGEKREEYREIKDYWSKRLIDKHYEFVVFQLGYNPKNRLTAKYHGFTVKRLSLKSFGYKLLDVYAIQFELINKKNNEKTTNICRTLKI